MDNRQIWLKPKPTHIDENFEDFLQYLKSQDTTPKSTSDTLYVESVRLLKERVALLMKERLTTPVYRQDKSTETLQFNVRLCGAWLLTITDAAQSERKQVFLTLTNSLIQLAVQNGGITSGQATYAHKNLPLLFNMAIRLTTHDVPEQMTFSWKDLITFSTDIFSINLLKMKNFTLSEGMYEGKGMLVTSRDNILLGTYARQVYEKKYLKKTVTATSLLPEYGFAVSTDKNLQIKESKKDNIQVVEEFVEDILTCMRATKKESEKLLLHYAEGEYVPAEVVESTSQSIRLKTIDPSYQMVEGELKFEQNLKIFSKIYPMEVWSRVMKPGDRFNVQVSPSEGTFSLTSQFLNFIHDNIMVDDLYDAHNRKAEDGRLNLREFWINAGFMVYVDLTEEEDKLLDEHDGYAGVEITAIGQGNFRGCLYGRIYDYEVETHSISREQNCPEMLKWFIEENSQLKLHQVEERYQPISDAFIKEFENTLNLLQSREVNPMLRYRILSVMRILCTLTENQKDDQYCQYISKYIKTLILFAQADSHEGKTVIPIEAPEDLKDEETVTNGADILNILACFGKGYDETSSVLDPYIEHENETLSKTASLVQSYNRLLGLLEIKTLRGIKRQILNRLSVVTDGDSTLELSAELEGIFGEEDDMKEFKSSFFEAPSNAKEQRQFMNIFRGICAMMNNRGGVLYLGVNDKGIPVGVKRDLEHLYRTYHQSPTLDAYMLYISRLGEEWFGETHWKYVTLKPMSEHNVVSIIIEPYPYDIVYLKDHSTYLRKNNASAPITDESTKEDIRRRRQENLRKTDDKTIILQDAIQKERQVRLMSYKSSNSGTIKNRIVEAFHMDNNEYIHCYEPDQDQIKIFRISRAEKVVMLEEPWQFKNKHKKLNIDPFHMSGETRTVVKLRLKLQAKNAIEEYYPGISQYIRQYDKNTWTLDTFTYNLYPLMVFYLSHAPYVEIVDAQGLKEEVKAYVKQYLHID